MKVKYYIQEKDKLKVAELANFIQKMDEYFIEPIYKRDHFISYNYLAINFLNNAKIIYCTYNDKLIGLVIFYADNLKYAFAFETYIGVLKEFNGLGIATELTKREMTLCSEIGMIGLMTNCNKENIKKKYFNKKMGFTEIVDKEEIDIFLKMNPKWAEKSFYKIIF